MSNIHIAHYNAISLAENNFKIKKMCDLVDKKILAFYNAHRFLYHRIYISD